MNPEAQKAYLVSTRALETGRLLFKVMLALAGILMVRLLMALGNLPAFRPSTVLLAAASASFLLVKTCKTRDLLHPVRVFGALWCFCLALASMHLLPLISDWNFLMWSCVLTALVSFIGGFWLAGRFWDRRSTSVGAVAAAEALSGPCILPRRKALLVAGGCVAIGVAVLTYEFWLLGAIPVLSENPDVTRMALFGAGGHGANPRFDTLFIKFIHPFVEFTKYGIFLAFLVLFQEKRMNRKEVFTAVLIILLGTLAYVAQAGRSFVVSIVFTAGGLFHYLRHRIKLTHLTAALLILFVSLGSLGAIRTRISSSASIYERARNASSFPEGELWDGIAFGYGTLTLSLEVFYRLTEDLRTTQRPESGFLFYSLHRIIPRANIQEFAYDLYSGVFITPTFLGEFYADYGYGGVLFGPLILGLAYGWVYLRGRGSNELYWIYVRAMFLEMLLFFPYVNLFSQYITWMEDMLVMYLLIRYVGQRAPELRLSYPAGKASARLPA